MSESRQVVTTDDLLMGGKSNTWPRFLQHIHIVNTSNHLRC